MAADKAKMEADKAKEGEVKVPKVAHEATMPEPVFKMKQIDGGPGSIPEFLKKKPMEEKKEVKREPEEEKKKLEEPKERQPLEVMLKKANEARAASDAAEKEMKKGEEQLRNIEIQVEKQEREVENLRAKAKQLEEKSLIA